MSDEETKLAKKKKKESIKPVVPKTAVDLQRLQYEKLMKDPVSWMPDENLISNLNQYHEATLFGAIF